MTANTAPAATVPARLLYPSTFLVLLSNLIPLAGVLFWGWDTFVLLMLYWLETLVIAFWTLMRILVTADFTRNILGEIVSRLFMFVFFLIHSGGFMAGHFIFLWAFFSGDWSTKLQLSRNFWEVAPAAFWNQMVLANGLLIPLAISFVGRGIAFVFEAGKLPLWTRLVDTDASDTNPGQGALVGGLYTRIVIMHVVILGGAALAQKFGSLAPIILLVVLKTIVDLWLFVTIDLKGRGATPAAP